MGVRVNGKDADASSRPVGIYVCEQREQRLRNEQETSGSVNSEAQSHLKSR